MHGQWRAVGSSARLPRAIPTPQACFPTSSTCAYRAAPPLLPRLASWPHDHPERGSARWAALQEPPAQLDSHVHDYFMGMALEEAQCAAAKGEVPVGAVLVHQGQVIARAHNQTHTTHNPVAHAEMLCILEAAQKLQAWRLLESTLYVTLEPCPMCAGTHRTAPSVPTLLLSDITP